MKNCFGKSGSKDSEQEKREITKNRCIRGCFLLRGMTWLRGLTVAWERNFWNGAQFTRGNNSQGFIFGFFGFFSFFNVDRT